VVTTFEFKPEAGIKLQPDYRADRRFVSRAASRIHFDRAHPGKSTIGIEVPNDKRQPLALREIIEAPEFMNSPSKLTLAMGGICTPDSRDGARGHAALADRRSTGTARACSSIR